MFSSVRIIKQFNKRSAIIATCLKVLLHSTKISIQPGNFVQLNIPVKTSFLSNKTQTSD